MAIEPELLRQQVIEHLKGLGMILDEAGEIVSSQMSKDAVKRLHAPATRAKLNEGNKWIKSKISKYQHYFADGCELNVAQVKPKLVLVREPWQNDLWRLARYTWFLPYSQGYGRRMRYLVMDESNDKLMGIFALQSPPIGFPARDRMFSYTRGEQKTALVNQTMDLHTLGGIMPYARLLSGKLATA